MTMWEMLSCSCFLKDAPSTPQIDEKLEATSSSAHAVAHDPATPTRGHKGPELHDTGVEEMESSKSESTEDSSMEGDGVQLKRDKDSNRPH